MGGLGRVAAHQVDGGLADRDAAHRVCGQLTARLVGDERGAVCARRARGRVLEARPALSRAVGRSLLSALSARLHVERGLTDARAAEAPVEDGRRREVLIAVDIVLACGPLGVRLDEPAVVVVRATQLLLRPNAMRRSTWRIELVEAEATSCGARAVVWRGRRRGCVGARRQGGGPGSGSGAGPIWRRCRRRRRARAIARLGCEPPVARRSQRAHDRERAPVPRCQAHASILARSSRSTKRCVRARVGNGCP